MVPSSDSAQEMWGLHDRRYGLQSNVDHPMHLPREGEHHDGRYLGLGSDSHNRAPVPSNDELRFLRADTEEAMNGLLDAREMAESARDPAAAATKADERTRQEQQGLVERLLQLETAAFGGPSRTSLHGLVQDLIPVVVSVVDRGCRTAIRHRRAGKILSEIRR
uniref:Uncharacterized protein n=1 Tax=Hyaloperonospora arabidopsidis (strain Emoy2) TaxID=559515 RepID=M4B918_HYAAE